MGYVAQIQARFNERPEPEDVPHVLVLLDHLRTVMPDLDDPDWIVRDERDGSRHHRDWMPDGIHLKGDRALYPAGWKRLPTAMRVEGDVNLHHLRAGVLDLEMGLHVTGTLRVRGAIRLTGEVVVEGDLDLTREDDKTVPEGVRVTGKVLTEGENFDGFHAFVRKAMASMAESINLSYDEIAGLYRNDPVVRCEVEDRARDRMRGDMYTLGHGQILFRPMRAAYRVMDEADEWCDVEPVTIRGRVTRREGTVTITYQAAEIRRTAEPGVPRHLQRAPHYRQIEHRGGRRPLR